MLDGRPHRRFQCGVDSPQIARKLGELRSTALTKTRSNACFLVGIISIISHISVVSTPFRLILAQNTNIFIFLHQKQVKSVEITPN